SVTVCRRACFKEQLLWKLLYNCPGSGHVHVARRQRDELRQASCLVRDGPVRRCLTARSRASVSGFVGGWCAVVRRLAAFLGAVAVLLGAVAVLLDARIVARLWPPDRHAHEVVRDLDLRIE